MQSLKSVMDAYMASREFDRSVRAVRQRLQPSKLGSACQRGFVKLIRSGPGLEEFGFGQ